ncbi:MAG TPA: group 2 glycosyl transferase [Acidimicrobiaceae bacterium]|nr:group 2 glycosyl transferase [Acidimicrobiaceae bacterium]
MGNVLFGFFVVCAIELGLATILLVLFGDKLRHASILAGALLVLAAAWASGEIVTYTWAIASRPIEAAQVLIAVLGLGTVAVRRSWNPVGQLFFSAFASAVVSYLAFAFDITFSGDLSPLGSLASLVLLVLEVAALVLALSFAFETCDVVCRVRHDRLFPSPDPGYMPRVSLHIAAYNEPPQMLIETIKSLEALDYPDFEIVVVDNNTKDPDVWQPVMEYARSSSRVRFVHVDPWPGFKSGALNLVLERYCDPAAEIVGVVDADYRVDPQYLRQTVGYFADPNVAFVQTPQDYRDWRGSSYFTACYDAYRYFFAAAMPSRNERNSIIFAGTMGLLRRSLLESIGGWDEWCITEDAETSLRLLMAGYSGMYVAKSFGQGIMPLTFSALKSQRFRWCFGGMQILRRHWRSLLPWDRSPGNHLSVGQRLDYLFGGLQWFNDLVYLGFTVVLLCITGLLLSGQSVALRPLVGPTAMLPAALIAAGLMRSVWALRQRTRITLERAVLAFLNWLSLSWTVARACIQGLIRKEGVFLRTPKTAGSHGLGAALRAASPETLLGLLLWGSAGALAVVTAPSGLLMGLVAWQGVVYMSSPAMAWMNQRARLTPELEARRRTEELRERLAQMVKPAAVAGSFALGLASAVLITLVVVGSTNAGHPGNPFGVPPRTQSDSGPWGGAVSPAAPAPAPSPSTTTTTTTTIPSSTTSTVGGTSTTTSTPSSSTTTVTAPTSTTTTAP